MTGRTGRGHGPVQVRLRALTGVDEEILDGIPTERPRYTAMGAVVLGTALLAMFSLATAITFIFDGLQPLALPVVAIWGWFIISLDRWLMSSVSAVGFGRRLLRLLPRVLLAVAIGAVIAEPLVLGVFQSAIVERVRLNRADELVELESTLLTCNPVPGTAEQDGASADPGCDEWRLSLTDTSLEGKETEREKLRLQVGELQAQVDADTKRHGQLEFEARKECAGTSGPGLTGEAGEGPNCLRLRAQADAYHRDHRIDENTEKLADLRGQVDGLVTEIGGRSDEFAAARSQAIAKELEEARGRHQGIGLLERMRTLGELTDENSYARAGEWGLRILLILVDALPALVKFLSGFTSYDAVVANRLRTQEQALRAADQTALVQATLHQDLVRGWLERQHAVRMRRMHLEALDHMQAVDAEREQIVDQRAAYLISEAPTAQLSLLQETYIDHDSPPDPWQTGRDEPPIDR
jgi:hypothetical protein